MVRADDVSQTSSEGRRPSRSSRGRTKRYQAQAQTVQVFSHDCLRKNAFFASRSNGFLEAISELLRVEVYHPGDVIMEEGTLGDQMYFLHIGSVEVLAKHSQERVATLLDGSVFGEMAMFMHGAKHTRTATVKALEFCDCRVIQYKAFSKVLGRFPADRRFFQKLSHDRHEALLQATEEAQESEEEEEDDSHEGPLYWRDSFRHSEEDDDGRESEAPHTAAPSVEPPPTAPTTATDAEPSADAPPAPQPQKPGADGRLSQRHSAELHSPNASRRLASRGPGSTLPPLLAGRHGERTPQQRREAAPPPIPPPIARLKDLSPQQTLEAQLVAQLEAVRPLGMVWPDVDSRKAGRPLEVSNDATERGQMSARSTLQLPRRTPREISGKPGRPGKLGAGCEEFAESLLPSLAPGLQPTKDRPAHWVSSYGAA